MNSHNVSVISGGGRKAGWSGPRLPEPRDFGTSRSSHVARRRGQSPRQFRTNHGHWCQQLRVFIHGRVSSPAQKPQRASGCRQLTCRLVFVQIFLLSVVTGTSIEVCLCRVFIGTAHTGDNKILAMFPEHVGCDCCSRKDTRCSNSFIQRSKVCAGWILLVRQPRNTQQKTARNDNAVCSWSNRYNIWLRTCTCT